MAAAFSALFAIFGRILSYMTEIHKRVQSIIHFKDDVSASSAVTAVRSTIRNIQFTPEAHMSVSAVS